MPAVRDTIQKTRPTGDYAIVDDTELGGGYRVVADSTERDAIVTNQRKIGMIVYVQADELYYGLEGGITNSDWVDLGKYFGSRAANRMNRATASNSSPYNPSSLTADEIIGCDTTDGEVSVTISTEDVESGLSTDVRKFTIKDEGLNASVNNITIQLENNDPGVSGLIDGEDTYIITINGNSVSLYVDGENAWTI